MTGFTLTEKILARAAGQKRCRAGEELLVKPDLVLGYDFPGYTDVMFRQMEDEFGVAKLNEPQRFAMFIDHMVPATTAADVELHASTRRWGVQHGVRIVQNRGIGHQVAAEIGFATPGALVVHFDGHVSQLGAFGTLAIGLRKQILEALVRERIRMTVPATVRVNLTGQLAPGVMARDVFHHLLRLLGPAFCNFQVLEFGGKAVANMSLASRQTLTGLAMFTGAVSAVVNPDEAAFEHLRGLKTLDLPPQISDTDAHYSACHTFDISAFDPVVVLPPHPANTRSLTDFIGTPVQVGYLGSCASGRLEDLRAAAQVLRGRQVNDGFRLHVVPTSQDILRAAADEGLIGIFASAGAFVSSPSCDYCYGRIGVTGPGERAISTGTLNVPGRMGSASAEIYTASAASVAAAAIAGAVADPRPYFA